MNKAGVQGKKQNLAADNFKATQGLTNSGWRRRRVQHYGTEDGINPMMKKGDDEWSNVANEDSEKSNERLCNEADIPREDILPFDHGRNRFPD